jgi:hypothetical protein
MKGGGNKRDLERGGVHCPLDFLKFVIESKLQNRNCFPKLDDSTSDDDSFSGSVTHLMKGR